MAADPFTDALRPHRADIRVPVFCDGQAVRTFGRRHAYGVRVTLRGDEGYGFSFSALWCVGDSDAGAVDTDAAIAAADSLHPGCVYQDWTAA
jgi:hypothetical protein